MHTGRKNNRVWYLRLLVSSLIFVIVQLSTSTLYSKVYLNKDDALKLAFPGSQNVERKTLFLEEADVKEIEALSKVRLDSKIFTYYVGIGKDGVLGYAYLGSHIVRTKPAVYMVVVSPDARLQRVEILAFYEQEEYLHNKRWFNQFQGKVLNEGLWPKREISAVSGATLSVNGITSEVRKVLSIFHLKVIKEGVL